MLVIRQESCHIVSSIVSCTWCAEMETFASCCSSWFLLKPILSLGNVNLLSSKDAQEPLGFIALEKML